MFVLRCTKKLLDRMGRETATDSPASATRLGDWSANHLVIRRQHLVLAVSHKSLLPILVPLAPSKSLLERIPAALEEVLGALEIEPTLVAQERAAMVDTTVAKTNDRRVVGILVDFANLLESFYDGRPLLDVALHLAKVPCSPIGHDSPDDRTRELFRRPELRLVR